MFSINEGIPAVDLEPVKGVYEIRCRATRRMYVGQSGRLQSRVTNHVTKLGQYSHENAEMQHDWAVFGADNFEIVMVHEVEDKAKRLEVESYRIDRRLIEGVDLYNQGVGLPAKRHGYKKNFQDRLREYLLEQRRRIEKERRQSTQEVGDTPHKNGTGKDDRPYVHDLSRASIPEELYKTSDDDFYVDVYLYEGEPDFRSDDYLNEVMNAFDYIAEDGYPFSLAKAILKYIRPEDVGNLAHLLVCQAHTTYVNRNTEKAKDVWSKIGGYLDKRVILGRWCAAGLDGELDEEGCSFVHANAWSTELGTWYKDKFNERNGA